MVLQVKLLVIIIIKNNKNQINTVVKILCVLLGVYFRETSLMFASRCVSRSRRAVLVLV